ncbi:MAG TPA: hypothetical protein VKE88_03840 [Candidatus Nanoarchaeia archaeon]|nr:hypothetical protein [Candidatus Nanoarchaeia archaeon]
MKTTDNKRAEFRLPTAKKHVVRMHPAALVFVVLVALAVGFAGARYGSSIGLKFLEQNNCIPQEDLTFFIDKANVLQEEYAGCVSDAWNLQLSCKAQIAALQNQLKQATNATK